MYKSAVSWFLHCMGKYLPCAVCTCSPRAVHIPYTVKTMGHEKSGGPGQRGIMGDSCFEVVTSHQRSPAQFTLGSTGVYVPKVFVVQIEIHPHSYRVITLGKIFPKHLSQQ